MTTRNTTIRNRHRAIIARDKPPCSLCGDVIDYSLKYPDPWSFVVDHVIPLARGGADTLENKAASHSLCNGRKLDKLESPVIRRSGSLKSPRKETP